MSIGLPVYNGAEYLQLALQSLLAQTYVDFELIISDNASTDQTEGICRRFAAADARIRYVRSDDNRGAAWNFNKVVELARGEYFKWAAHDDICAPTYLQRCVETLDGRPSAILCYTETNLIDAEGKEIGPYIDWCETRPKPPHERFNNIVDCYGLSNPFFGVIRTQFLRATRLLGSYVASDLVLLGELALAGQFVKVNEYLFLRRDHPAKSARANPTSEALSEWYDPENKGRIQLVACKLFAEYMAAIWRAPVSGKEKLLCYAHMAKWVRWRARNILAELVGGIRQKVQSRSHRRTVPIKSSLDP